MTFGNGKDREMESAKNIWQRYHVLIKLGIVFLVIVIILANVDWEPWKNGFEPAINNLNLNGVWPLEKLWGEGGTITISNFSWKEFDLSAGVLGELHLVLSPKNSRVENKMVYVAENRPGCEVTIELSSVRVKGLYEEILIIIGDIQGNSVRIGNCYIDPRILSPIE